MLKKKELGEGVDVGQWKITSPGYMRTCHNQYISTHIYAYVYMHNFCAYKLNQMEIDDIKHMPSI